MIGSQSPREIRVKLAIIHFLKSYIEVKYEQIYTRCCRFYSVLDRIYHKSSRVCMIGPVNRQSAKLLPANKKA